MIALAFVHGLVLAMWPVWPVIAVGLWWTSNTISHNFIHRPFFAKPWHNRMFSAYLSLLLGIPQALWRQLHLEHHAGAHRPAKVTLQVGIDLQTGIEAMLVLGLWATLAVTRTHFFLAAYLPGYSIGLLLCALQGHYEHVRGVVSHYGPVYNFLCFNDGYHAEHHAYPGVAWDQLPSRKLVESRSSAWPAPLRWIDGFGLEGLESLERLVLRSPALQRFVLSRHRQAIAPLLTDGISHNGADTPRHIQRVVIVGGGLFPRTALVLRDLLPQASILVIDANADHIAVAQELVRGVRFEQGYYHGEPLDCDLAVIPLCFDGDREALYRRPPAPVVLIHDWLWRRRGTGRIVSCLLLKRINRTCDNRP